MRKHKNDSQPMLVLNHLKTYGEITPLEALREYGVLRLGAIIFDLRHEGYQIATILETHIKPSGRKGQHALYRLEESNNA